MCHHLVVQSRQLKWTCAISNVDCNGGYVAHTKAHYGWVSIRTGILNPHSVTQALGWEAWLWLPTFPMKSSSQEKLRHKSLTSPSRCCVGYQIQEHIVFYVASIPGLPVHCQTISLATVCMGKLGNEVTLQVLQLQSTIWLHVKDWATSGMFTCSAVSSYLNLDAC